MKIILYPLACGLLALTTGCQDSNSNERQPAPQKEVVHDKVVPIPIPVPVEEDQHHYYHHHHYYYHEGHPNHSEPPHHH